MDPRLSSSLTPKPKDNQAGAAHPAPQLFSQPTATANHPVTPQHPPQPAPATRPLANAVSQPMTPQMVDAFPVKMPEAVSTPSQNAASRTNSVLPAAAAGQPENDLDKILQAVNNKVKTPDKMPSPKKNILIQKIFSKNSKQSDKPKNPKPIGPVIVVAIVALMLSSTAIFAYREGNRSAIAAKQAGKVGTSYTASSAIQEAGGALVSPGDLDNYAQTIQTKLNSLNDAQDFVDTSLSDKVLGL